MRRWAGSVEVTDANIRIQPNSLGIKCLQPSLACCWLWLQAVMLTSKLSIQGHLLPPQLGNSPPLSVACESTQEVEEKDVLTKFHAIQTN
ncbi:hypothetical protein V6N13_044911 [Hibiscus sabdariffa]|uniref:Uncharacterized protein n=1 Tax=Hibiscus sabdariffa TaxID=183260 RepID=A0ABR2RJJ3_9ROSI